jgi:DNA-binding Lrp family transcriptional regulator
MRTLDETDLHILRLLEHDGRRPYSEIGDEVGLSGPAVSDRVSRLRDLGVIRGFTVDVDRSTLRGGTPVLVRLDVDPASVASVVAALEDDDHVEHVYTTVDSEVVAHASVPEDAREWLLDAVAMESVRDYSVSLLASVTETESLGEGSLSLVCAECGNTVTDEGLTTRVGDDLKSFCCPSCESTFRERYEELKEGV